MLALQSVQSVGEADIRHAWLCVCVQFTLVCSLLVMITLADRQCRVIEKEGIVQCTHRDTQHCGSTAFVLSSTAVDLLTETERIIRLYSLSSL